MRIVRHCKSKFLNSGLHRCRFYVLDTEGHNLHSKNLYYWWKSTWLTSHESQAVLSSTGGWMVRALVCQADGRVFESNQWLSFDFQILSYLLRFKIRVGCGLDYGCGRRRTMSIPVRLRAAILGAKRSYSCSSDCLVLRLCQLLSSIYD